VATDQGGLLGAAAEELLENPDRIVDLLVRDELAVEQADLEHHDAGNLRHRLVGAVSTSPKPGLRSSSFRAFQSVPRYRLSKMREGGLGGEIRVAIAQIEDHGAYPAKAAGFSAGLGVQPRARPLIS